VADFCGEKTRGTLQIGEPAVIAALTGSVTVGDFRQADMAVGGEGAPLCPLPHYHLFKCRDFTRAVLNIGGIANITLIPKKGKMKDIFAFDTGPGNALIDTLVNKLYSKEYDKNGEIALKGKVNPDLLRKLKKNSYFEKKPPKSTGRKDFEENLRYILGTKRIPKQDIIATVTELTCWSIFNAYKKWIKPKTEIDQLVVCGGGSHNRYITKRLSMLFHPIRVLSSEKLGYNPDQIEAICFAISAYLTMKNKKGNLRKVTGAKKEVRLGKICLP
jgi:anhydro-N-acetylmuramic acid kinase